MNKKKVYKGEHFRKHLCLKRFRWMSVVLAVMTLTPVYSSAADIQTYTIILKDHRFEPRQLDVPIGVRIKLVIDNQDPTSEEFESYDLNREKVVGGNKKIIVFVGPLKPGSYKYFGEFHQETAQGVIVAE